MLSSRKIFIILILVILAAAAAALWQGAGRMSLAETIEREASRVLGTRVDVESAGIEWDAGAASIANLQIANPGGFSDRNMVSIESVDAGGELQAGLIERLTFEGIDVLIEFRGARSNFEVVGERAEDSEQESEAAAEEDAGGNGGGSGGEEEADDGGDPAVPGQWRIKTVSFENLRVSVQADWTDEVASFEVDGLALENLQGEWDDLTRGVVLRFLSGILDAGAGRVEDSRLRDSLAERAGALREKTREAGGAAQ